MDIKITDHAITQYRKKMFNFNISDEEVTKILVAIAKRGKRIHPRPTVGNPVYEIQYQKLSIAAEVTDNTITIITFLGDHRYRAWIRRKEIALRYA